MLHSCTVAATCRGTGASAEAKDMHGCTDTRSRRVFPLFHEAYGRIDPPGFCSLSMGRHRHGTGPPEVGWSTAADVSQACMRSP